MNQTRVAPDLQSSLACEDVRVEAGGGHTLVGVFSQITTHHLPVRLLKFCIWTRWCGGEGRFRQGAKLFSPEEQDPICGNEIEFELADMESHTTNVHFFSGLQLDTEGVYHVEISLDGELILRYPIAVRCAPHPHPIPESL